MDSDKWVGLILMVAAIAATVWTIVWAIREAAG